MRAFLGIPVSEAVQACALAESERFKALGVRGGWTRRENMHITLFFLGEVSYGKAQMMIDRYRSELEEWSVFPMVAEKVDGFSKQGNLRVLHVGFERSEPFVRLYRKGVELFVHFGYTFPPKNVPHMTLCRIKSYPNQEDLGFPAQIIPKVPMMVDTISLIHSTLTPQGPIYQELDRIRLQTKGG